MQPFSDRVKAVFEALNTSAHKFAKDYDLSRTSLFNIVSGRNQPVFSLVERICLAEPRISAEYLLRGEGMPLRDSSREIAESSIEELKRMRDELVLTINDRIEELEKASVGPRIRS